ncbi:hypothetical protein KDW93_17530 [Burkholderia ambifaria]|uniref:Uncharacterized protein n=1 Tax=Burkholderia ambifaria TaxID=152480 RepID=A0AA41JKE9_9BURK|nr:hypothetical protein [Burkholderia ambifaria]
MPHARAVIATWCLDYNEERSRSLLNYLSPA